MMPPGRHLRAQHAVEDLLASLPGGAATIAVVDRLLHAGLSHREAASLIEDLREEGVVAVEGGRWKLVHRARGRVSGAYPTAGSEPPQA